MLLFLKGHGVFENGIYSHYLKSIIHDLDFNILNQLTDPNDRWIVTRTYNHTDYHSPFVATLLSLPYLFMNLFLSKTTALQSFFSTFQVFISLNLFTAYIYRMYVKKYFTGNKLYICLLFLLALSTAPLLYFSFDPTELSIAMGGLSLFIFFELYGLLKKEITSTFFLNLAVSLVALMKVDGLFFFSAFFLFYALSKRYKSFFELALLVGFQLTQIAVLNFYRYGEFFPQFAMGMVFDHGFNGGIILWGVNGVFTKSPALLLGVVSYLIVLSGQKSREDKSIALVGLSIFASKVIIMGLTISPISEVFTARQFILDFPFMLYCLYVVACDHKKTILSLLGLCLIFNLYSTYSYFVFWKLVSLNYFFTYLAPWQTLTKFSSLFTGQLIFYWDNLTNHYQVLIVLSLVGSLFLVLMRQLMRIFAQKFMPIFISLLFLMTLFFSGFNAFYNPVNTAILKTSQLLDQSVVAKGLLIYYDETMDTISFVQNSHDRVGIPPQNQIDEFKATYLAQIKNDFLVDPIHFKKDLEAGKLRESFWQKKYPKSNGDL